MQTWLNAQRTQAPCRPMYLSTNISMTTISSGGDGSPQCTMSKLSKGFKWSTLTNQGSPPPFFFLRVFNISQSHNFVVELKVATNKKDQYVVNTTIWSWQSWWLCWSVPSQAGRANYKRPRLHPSPFPPSTVSIGGSSFHPHNITQSSSKPN